MNKEVCYFCQYLEIEEVDNAPVCVNPESEFCTLWVDIDGTCDCFEDWKRNFDFWKEKIYNKYRK